MLYMNNNMRKFNPYLGGAPSRQARGGSRSK